MRYLLLAALLLPFASFAKKLIPAADTIKVYFDTGIPEMQPASQRMIDSLVYIEKLRPGKKIGIIGYADYVGSEQSNVHLSEARANSVKAYLISMGIKEADIQTVIGKGEITRNTDTNSVTGIAEDRRVDIIPGGFKVMPKPIVPTQTPPPAQPKIDISKVKANETITLKNIYFLPGSHMVREESTPELERLYNVMADNPKLRIRIEGHICCLHDNHATDGYDYDAQDFNLSTNRARFIYDYLVEKGIDEDRLEYKGFGMNKPLKYPERSEEDENTNRRVEIRVLKK